jgi:hypothetical protein
LPYDERESGLAPGSLFSSLGVEVVGHIPWGLPSLTLPDASLLALGRERLHFTMETAVAHYLGIPVRPGISPDPESP